LNPNPNPNPNPNQPNPNPTNSNPTTPRTELQDTIVTREQRVFYVAFKWVQEHWPDNVEAGEHVSDVPVDVYLDGHAVHTEVQLKARIRIYNTAAHLVIGESSSVMMVVV
jgi:hypothetical protein